MKRIVVITLTLLIIVSPAVVAQEQGGVALLEFAQKEYLFEVVRHLYRWYLDETDLEKVIGKRDVAFWVRSLQPKLDPNDKSQFGELVMPAMNVKVSVKKPDYSIDELGLVVRDETFKITNVSRAHLPTNASGYTVVTTSYQEMRDYAHRTRMHTRFPKGNLLKQMRLSTRRQFLTYFDQRQNGELEGTSLLRELNKHNLDIHLAPLSEVANETWVFWEMGGLLLRFSSDVDLEEPALWQHEEMAVELFNIDEQTVVSLDEVPGSNAYLTRDQVGRVLFNCIVLGKRITLQPLAIGEQKQ